MCIAAEEGKQSFISGVATGESSIVNSDKKTSHRGKVIEVNCGPLGPLLEKHNIHHIDFMSLDIEGFEYQALKTVDFSKVKIDILIVESATEGTATYDLIIKNGYIGMGTLSLKGPNSAIDNIFVRKESIWFKYCTWEHGPRDMDDYQIQFDKYGIDKITHPWPRNCDIAQIEEELKSRNSS
jgi:hypothetical protein